MLMVAVPFSVEGAPCSLASRVLGVAGSPRADSADGADVDEQMALGPEENVEPRLGSIYTTQS